jgi:hypothetical protein
MRRGPFGYLNAMSEAVPGAKFVKGVGQAAFGAAQGKLESLRKENPKAFDKGMDEAPKGKFEKYDFSKPPSPIGLPRDSGRLGTRFEKSDTPTSSSEWDDDTKGNVGMDTQKTPQGKAKGGAVKMAKGGSVSARADGCAQRGKTKGRFV